MYLLPFLNLVFQLIFYLFFISFFFLFFLKWFDGLLLYYALILFFLVFVNLLYVFVFVFVLAVLGLRCCMQAFSGCREQGLLFIAVHGLLIAVASLVTEHGL